jgi:tetratricopeptide (TPR) repeat protein
VLLRPRTDGYGDRLTFGMPGWWRPAGRLVILAAAASITVLTFLHEPAGKARAALFIAFFVLALIGVLISLWHDEVELDLQSGRYRQQRGFSPFRQAVEGSLSEIRLVNLTFKNRINAYGEQEQEYTALLEGPERSLTLFKRWADPTAKAFAELVAARLEIGIEENSPPLKESRPGFRFGKAASLLPLMSLLIVGGVIMWPVLTGRTSPLKNARRTIMQMNAPDYSLLRDGERLLRTQQYVAAEKTLKEAAEKGIDRPNAFNDLAYALSGQGKSFEALAAAKMALSLAPQNGNILDTVGEMHELRKEFKEAAEYYEKAAPLMLDDNGVETHCKYGRTLLALNRKQEAITQLQLAMTYPPGPWRLRAKELLEQLGVKPIEAQRPPRPPRSMIPYPTQ